MSFTEQDRKDRNTFMNAVRTEAGLIRDRLMGLHKLMNDAIFVELHDMYDAPIQINVPNLLKLENRVKFILSDKWEKEYNELFDALDESGVEYSIFNLKDSELICFTLVLKPSEYHLAINMYTYSNRIDISEYYMNTYDYIDEIPNKFPENKNENMPWKQVVSIWLSEIQRIADEGWELFS